MSISQIELLHGSNFKTWKSDIEMNLGILEYDHVLREFPPATPAEDASRETKEDFEKWHKHNKMALIMIKKGLHESVRGSIPESDIAKVFYESIAEKFKISDKAEVQNLMKAFTRMKFTGKTSVREYIMRGTDIAARLRALNMTIDESFLVYMLLNSLSNEYSQLQALYKTQEEKWSVNKLISLCVEVEDEKQKQETELAVNLVNHMKYKKHFGNRNAKPGTSVSAPKTTMKTDLGKMKYKPAGGMKCFFCKKPGHFKKDCEGFKAWLKKKGNFLSKIVFTLESNDFKNDNSWWFDTGSPIHIVNSLQGLSRISIPSRNETKVCTANGQRVAVKAVGIVKLKFSNGYVLVLDNVYCIPSISRNLISGSQYVRTNGFSFSSDNKIMQFYYNMKCFGDAALLNGYWHVNCTNVLNETEQKEVFVLNKPSLKRKFCDTSSFLWHKRLGHISKQRLVELVKQEILPPLNFADFETCIDCLKGKMTNSRKTGSKRSEHLLDLIHTDICGPFPVNTICGNCYFITFIDDFSRYCHLYLISEKSQALEYFKIYKAEVEKQTGRFIKVIRSDRGGEYYGRYTEKGQHKGAFALYLQECGIMAQYTTPYNPQQNGVSERRNRTLMSMVRSMIVRSGLPKFLWGEALKTANYICNRTPSKAVIKTPFELWCGFKPSLNHFHVWGCDAEIRVQCSRWKA